MNENKRREFIKKSAFVAAGISIVASSGLANSTGVKKGKIKKNEVLYERTPEWNLYYERSK